MASRIRDVFLLLLLMSALTSNGRRLPAQEVSSEEARLVSILKDAQASRSKDYERGRMDYRIVFHVYPAKEPAIFEGTVYWAGKNRFWAYKHADPAEITGRENAPSLDKALTEYVLILDNKYYVYNPKLNKVMLHPFFKNQDGGADFEFLHVLPDTLWSVCCPPRHLEGRPWVEFIGRASFSMDPDDHLRIEREPGNIVVQTTTTRGQLRQELRFSLEHEGRVVSSKYFPEGKGRSRFGEYHWKKDAQGHSLLESCVFTETPPGGDPSEVEMKFEFQATNIAVGKDVSTQCISLEAYKSLLPQNALIVDNLINRTYPLNASAVEANGTQPLVDEVRSRGFLKK